ncbi:flagellar motor protein MotB [Anaerocolumna sp. AGMB13025]|uniref:OmpA/MotB family protein n=1 Tax=Anaerocolumna sp. AGMB13025 TaxID=3039116 RepID=UPI00241C53CB|nr:flagellar motor protein MotB [Anaerocolumna sp. AGMB13025]WFR54971.1 flagellar motor protein MotB [Anaerocolumna sp. AGMB13025]
MARKKKAEEASAGAPWLSTFADLMNLLLCFFVLLFASSTVDAEKYEEIVASMSSSFSIFSGGQTAIDEGKLISSGISQLNDLSDYYNTTGESVGESETEETDAMQELMEEKKKASQAIYDKVSDMADKNSLGDYIELSIDSNYQYVKISLSGSILFDSGKAEIKADAVPIFSKLGDILEEFKEYHIELEGHTDNVPVKNKLFKNNNWLSSARALNAATYLMNEKGLNPKTLSWTGRGEYDPVASNATPEGRAKNRRVEIKIYNNINN